MPLSPSLQLVMSTGVLLESTRLGEAVLALGPYALDETSRRLNGM